MDADATTKFASHSRDSNDTESELSTQEFTAATESPQQRETKGSVTVPAKEVVQWDLLL